MTDTETMPLDMGEITIITLNATDTESSNTESTDTTVTATTAATTAYDNAQSGLSAETVQDALDELSTQLQDAITELSSTDLSACVLSETSEDLPTGVNSGYLLTCGDTQLLITQNGIYSRDCDVWTEWTTSATDIYSGVLPDAYDLNDVATQTVYTLIPSNNYANVPPYVPSGYLITYGSDTVFCGQLLTGHSGYFFRQRYASGVWTPWQALVDNRNIHIPIPSTTEGGRTGYYVAFGSSYVVGRKETEKDISEYNFTDAIGKACGLTVINRGLSGGGLFQRSTENGDAVNRDAAYTHISTYLEDVQNADLVTIAYGGMGNSEKALGTPFDTTGAETLCGKQKEILELVLTHCPGTVVMIGEFCCHKNVSDCLNYTYSGGWTTRELNRVFSQIAAMYDIPFVDTTTMSFNRNYATLISNDKEHPTDAGYYYISSYLAPKVAAEFTVP